MGHRLACTMDSQDNTGMNRPICSSILFQATAERLAASSYNMPLPPTPFALTVSFQRNTWKLPRSFVFGLWVLNSLSLFIKSIFSFARYLTCYWYQDDQLLSAEQEEEEETRAAMASEAGKENTVVELRVSELSIATTSGGYASDGGDARQYRCVGSRFFS